MNENGIYPFFTCDAKPFRINTYAFDTEAIIISGNGSQVGHINYYNGKFNAYQSNNIRKLVNRYAKQSCNQYSLTTSDIKSWTIPLPSLEQQEDIVSVLDRFDAICNDLTSGLPAEIAARQKQYEYYRDKLLTFKELEI